MVQRCSLVLLYGCDLDCDPQRAYLWGWEAVRTRQGRGGENPPLVGDIRPLRNTPLQLREERGRSEFLTAASQPVVWSVVCGGAVMGLWVWGELWQRHPACPDGAR